MKYEYKQLKDPCIEDVNDLGQQGWRFIDRNRVKDSELLYLDESTGNVGIGTDSPAYN